MEKFLLKLTAMSLICTLFVGQSTHLTYGEEVAELKNNVVLKTEKPTKDADESNDTDELSIEQLEEKNRQLKDEIRKELRQNVFIPFVVVVSFVLFASATKRMVGYAAACGSRISKFLYEKFGCLYCDDVARFLDKWSVFGEKKGMIL